ncbi:hypothetical protein D3C79_1046260 [compost metagenome]
MAVALMEKTCAMPRMLATMKVARLSRSDSMKRVPRDCSASRHSRTKAMVASFMLATSAANS